MKKTVILKLKPLHNFSGVEKSGDAILSQNDNTRDYLEKVAVYSDDYIELFGKQKQGGRRFPIVKIIYTNQQNNEHCSIWRVADTKGVTGVTKGVIALPFGAMWELKIHNVQNAEVEVKKGCCLPFYWNHPDHAARVATRIGLLSVILSLIGIVLSIVI